MENAGHNMGLYLKHVGANFSFGRPGKRFNDHSKLKPISQGPQLT